MQKTDRLMHVPPGESEAFWVAGELVVIKARSEDTGGAYSLTEEAWPPEVGPPPHIHHTQDETFYVLEGKLEFVSEDGATRAAAGSLVHIPKGMQRAYKNPGPTNARAIVLFTPGGFEGFFEEVGEPVTGPASPPSAGEPDLERLTALAAKYGCEILPPPSTQEANFSSLERR
jgi:quercetin dioxygenase-like cupin family protein